MAAGSKLFLAAVYKRHANKTVIIIQNKLLKLEFDKSWSEVLADVCPAISQQPIDREQPVICVNLAAKHDNFFFGGTVGRARGNIGGVKC